METHPLPPARSLWRWFPEFLELGRTRYRSQIRLMGSSVLVGIVTGLAAVVFFIAFQIVVHFTLNWMVGYHPHPPSGEPELPWLPPFNTPLRPWLFLIVPTVGGLLSGVIVFTLAPEAEGHGTDSVIAAYHYHQGQMRSRVPLIKIIATAITIGTGGSGGQEGPITQIGGGSGSVVANLLRLRPAERRILLAAGMGAGIAAIFRAPLAGALFAAEVLYSSSEFEPEVIIPAGIASVLAYCTFGLCTNAWKPLVFSKELLPFDDPWQLGPYLILALCMVLLAMLYTRSFYGCQRLFHHLPIKPHFKPAIGAGLSGLVGLVLFLLFRGNQQVLGVLSTGYGVLQDSLSGGRSLALVLVAVALGKILTTSLTIGSGGSGGVFGPAMVIGGCGGGAVGALLRHLPAIAHFVPQPGSFVIVGMAGFFAAAAKTPFSALVIVTEMTGNYNLLLPALWVCTIGFLLSDKQSLYASQLESRSRSPAHQGSYVREVLAGMTVRQFLTPGLEVPILQAGDTLTTVIQRLNSSPYPILPVVDKDRHLLGVVNPEEIHLAAQSPEMQSFILAEDLMRADLHPLRPEHGIDRALELFVENDLMALPVVDGEGNQQRFLGIIRRSDIARTYLRHVQGMGTPH